ncbi:uncharacterized protein LOC106167525 [Lingula anatina]|uniref:Uncharacterized protein LOC106167525 n=1 Tax=Lingula anatina TaxID=7574 RepID=A0A1S3IU96_LINAN|nr:uncharacterized protein LOC106167525 [Lingula anatina]|eukprot:XP_013401780.1 uncharacterized protein LOC106167525 [Lingula anatina]
MKFYVIYLCLVVALVRPTLCKDEKDYVSKDSSALPKADLHGTTLHYHYESEAKLFGPAEETFHISADVDVEYIGDGFVNYLDNNASSFLMFMRNVFVQVIKGNGTTSESEAPLSADDLYDQPTWFVQLGNGTIAEARFTKKDLGNTDVMNFKRSILSALQTNLVRDKENVIETDVMGTHNSRYSLTELQFGEIEVKKHVSSKDIYVDNNTDLDTDEVDIETDEVQRVSGGILTSVSGHVQVFQKPVEQDDTTANPEEGGNIDLGVYLTSNVTFTLTLRKHVKRSVEGVQRIEAVANAQFQKRSLVGQYDQVSGVYQRWTILRKKFDKEDKLSQAVTNFMKDPTDPSKCM